MMTLASNFNYRLQQSVNLILRGSFGEETIKVDPSCTHVSR